MANFLIVELLPLIVDASTGIKVNRTRSLITSITAKNRMEAITKFNEKKPRSTNDFLVLPFKIPRILIVRQSPTR